MRLTGPAEAIEWVAPLTKQAPFMGSVISEAAAQGVLEAQSRLLELGGRALVASWHLKPGTGLLSPGLIDVTAAVNVPTKKIFGPVLQVYRYRDFDEAIRQANNTRFEAVCRLFSESRERFEDFYDRIRAGIVNWNKQLTGASSAAPFGGIGASGNHRASAYYAADYCSYPVAGGEADQLALPASLSPVKSFKQALAPASGCGEGEKLSPRSAPRAA